MMAVWLREIYNAYEPDNIVRFVGKLVDEGERYRMDVHEVTFNGGFKDGPLRCWEWVHDV